VPHVFGEGDGASDRGVFFGLGYAHAQDRMFQMELLRRTAQGRLSERFGARTLDTDEYLRRLGLYRAAETSVAAQGGEARAALEAYAAGVNARLAETGGGAGAAPEFLLFRGEIEAWRPADSLAILKLLALQLASHVDREVLRARMSLAVPPGRVYDILPDDPGAPRVDVPDYRALFPTLPEARQTASAAPPETPVPPSGLSSNAWAAGPGRTVTGASLLANDPHLDLTAPGIWYLARLSLDAGDVIGATIPGIPGVLSGRTRATAWGVTAANIDDQDVFIERLNPDDPREVLTPAGWRPLREETVDIAVKGGAPRSVTLQWSDNGPVLPGRYHDLAAVTPPGHVAALARTLFAPDDTSFTALFRLMQARSVSEIVAAAEGWVAPAVNLTVADGAGVALQLAGRVPLRDAGHETAGRMPSAGWKARNRWQGMAPFADNPRILTPATGTVGNTNDRTVTRDFPNHVSFDWGDTARGPRLRALLAATPRFSAEDFAAMQRDAVDGPAAWLVPLLLSHAGDATGAAGDAQAALAAWDGEMAPDRPEPLIYAAWLRALQDRLVADAVPHLAPALARVNPVFLARVLEDTEGAGAWCRPDCASVVRAARDAALAGITRGGRVAVDALRWGDVHVARHPHPALGDVPVLGRLTEIRHPMAGGDDTLLRALTRGGPMGAGARPFDAVHAAGYRAVVDLAAPETSRFVLATGQSGHPLSRHFRDQNRLWRAGRSLPMELDGIAAQGGGADRLTIAPAP
jgi:penicillin amidase